MDKLYAGWISVEDRLPEEGEVVLIADDAFFGGLIHAIASIERGSWEWRDDMSTAGHPRPTHWMPLPELPESV